MNYVAGSINLICVPLGCLMSGTLTQPLGRKRSMILVNVPFIVAWIMFHYASNVGMLYASLVLTGLSGGLLEAPVSCVVQCWRDRRHLFSHLLLVLLFFMLLFCAFNCYCFYFCTFPTQPHCCCCCYCCFALFPLLYVSLINLSPHLSLSSQCFTLVSSHVIPAFCVTYFLMYCIYFVLCLSLEHFLITFTFRTPPQDTIHS
jgi:predicted MFS family arabinose efflux permease